jgi:beta-glucosidase
MSLCVTPSTAHQGCGESAQIVDVAIVVVNESEDGDRANLTLPGAQDDLVAAAVRSNPNTIVVLNPGAPVLMPWLSEVRGVVESWSGGQDDGAALAFVLYGDVSRPGSCRRPGPRA